jgi:cytidylate kinase
MEARAERIVRLYGESEKKHEERLKDKDTKRAINYKHFTGGTWGDSRNYDLCLNSETFGIERCIEMIIEVAKL